jgi:hypothetical protein
MRASLAVWALRNAIRLRSRPEPSFIPTRVAIGLRGLRPHAATGAWANAGQLPAGDRS